LPINALFPPARLLRLQGFLGLRVPVGETSEERGRCWVQRDRKVDSGPISSAFDRNYYEFASRLIAFELGSEANLISNGSAEAVGNVAAPSALEMFPRRNGRRASRFPTGVRPGRSSGPSGSILPNSP